MLDLAGLNFSRNSRHRLDDILDEQLLLLDAHQTKQIARLGVIIAAVAVTVSISITVYAQRRLCVLWAITPCGAETAR